MSTSDDEPKRSSTSAAPSPGWRARVPEVLGWLSLVVVVARAATHWSDDPGGDAWDYIRSIHDFSGSRFPPGFPVLLFPLSGSLTAMRLLGTAFTVALVVLIWASARRVAGWWAASLAGVLVVLSPLVTDQASQIMTDAPAAAFGVGALLAILYGRERLAAVLIGLSAWLRIVQAAFLLALPRKVWLTCAVVLLPLLVYNLAMNGSLTGYAPGQAEFRLDHVVGAVRDDQHLVATGPANWQLYPLILLGLRGGVVPGLLVLGAVGVWRHWSTAAGFAAKVVGIDVAMYLFYYWQSPRFCLPAISVLLVYAATSVVPRADAAPRRGATAQPDATPRT